MKRNSLSRRDFLRMTGVTAAGAVLVACQPAMVQQGATDGEAPAAAPVDLAWWSFGLGLPSEEWPHGKWEGELAAAYSEQNPGATIEYQALGWDSLAKVYTSISAGNPPNLVLRAGHGMLTYALQAGNAIEVELQEDLESDLPPGWLDGMKWRGKNYFVPFYVHAQGPLLNITIAKEAGVEDLIPAGPDRAWDFDQWLELMKASSFQREDGSDVYGYVVFGTASNPFFHWTEWLSMWNWGADTTRWNEQENRWVPALDEELGLSWLQFMQDLYFVHEITPNPSGLDSTQTSAYWEQNQNAYLAGPAISMARQQGATVDPDTLVVTDPLGFEWIFVRNPTQPGVEHTTWGGAGLDVNLLPFRTEDDTAIEPTIEFAHWLVNGEHQEFLAQYLFPVRQSALKAVEGDPLVQWMFNNWIPNSRNRNPTGCTREEAEAFQTSWQRLWLPEAPDAVARDFRQQVEQFACWVDV